MSQIHLGAGSASGRSETGREYLLEEEQRGESEVCSREGDTDTEGG